ncbi:hypothetical protein [Aulosira sp. FACHB-615]|uniref:hypothetical protein n=1 Tax=Aulosira sp. FACHB-615 TaxID=2692777 RepID=UPI00168544BA|nr:hypothetical protein [Aulosira sp. FACHB-615]MBD2492519.1 hypothetical protein [Aulosira sp. FACHB-615]
MTHPTYTQQALANRKLGQLKTIAVELGVTPTGNKTQRQTWIKAIASHQSEQIQKVVQTPAIAPELTTVEINSNHFEIYADKWLIAYITYDWSEYVTQPWVVMVNGVEKFRDTTQARCYRFIQWHHQELNPQPDAEIPEVPIISDICFYDQEGFAHGELIASITYSYEQHHNPEWRVIVNDLEIFRDTTPARCHSYIKQQYQAGTLPVQEPFEEPCTDNRTMAHIFNECQKYGFEPLDDGIYKGDVKLGEVGYTNGNWWVIKGCSGQQYSDSVFDAVRSLLVLSDCEQLLDQPFEMLTAQDWQRLREYEPVSELVAA